MNKIITIAIVGLFMAACSKSTPKQESVINVKVKYPQIGFVQNSYTFPAYLGANQEVNLVARIPGALEKVCYPTGGYVKRGTSLFVIEPESYRDKVESAKAQLLSAQAQLEYTQSNYERMERSSKSNAVSQNDLQQAKSAYQQAEAAVKQAKSQLDEASLNLSYCYINAPFSGQVSKHTIDAGNYLNGGETLATIYDESKLTVEFSMGYNQFANLPKPIEQIIAHIVLGNDTIPAKMSYAAPSVTLQTGTLAAQAVIDNTSNKLKSGVYVNLIIPYRTNPNAILIPQSSVGTSLNKNFVYILNRDKSVTLSEVVTGEALENGMIEIISGLNADQPYLVDALSSIRPGMKVNPIVTE